MFQDLFYINFGLNMLSFKEVTGRDYPEIVLKSRKEKPRDYINYWQQYLQVLHKLERRQ